MLRETIVPIGDLRQFCLQCSECGTQITLDLYGTTNISNCPICRKEFDDLVGGNITALSRALQQLENSKHKFFFRVATKE